MDLYGTNLKPIPKKSSIVEDVIQELSNFILSGVLEGNFKTGDRLPSERELAERLGVGRSTMREAMKVLTILGLLEVRTGQGTYITDGTSDFYAAPLAWGLIIGEKSITELIEARLLLECQATYYTTLRASDEELRELTDTYLSMKNAVAGKDVRLYLEADVKFHMFIAKSAHNNVITQLLKTIRKLLELWITKVLGEIKNIEVSFKEHENIYNCIIKRDADGAKEAMLLHIDSAANMLNKVLIKRKG